MRAFLLLLLLPTLTIAQTWAPIGAKWTYTQATINPNYTTYTTFESIADTIVGGQSCRTIQKIEHSSPATSDSLEFYMYSDSNRIFYRMDTTWCLLYNFNAQQGDTFQLDCFLKSDGQPLIVTVLSVDTITINGHQRKRFTYLADDIFIGFSGTVIEGIGHTMDMFPTYDNFTRGPLRCYEDNDLGLYKNEYYYGSTWSQDCDKIITGIDNQLDIKKTVLFPNPFTDKVTIAFSSNEQTTICLFDLLGQLVLQQTFTNSLTINTEQLADGIFFYELRNSKGILKTAKVFKQ